MMQARPVLAAMLIGAGLVSLACAPKRSRPRIPLLLPKNGNCVTYDRRVACGDASMPIPMGRYWLNTQQVYESGVDRRNSPYWTFGKRIVISKEPSLYQGPR